MRPYSIVAAATLLTASLAAHADTTQIIVNGNFETGSLSPFVSDTQYSNSRFAITSTGCFAGTYCATASDNAGLKQTFAGVSTGSINQVSFEIAGGGPNSYDFFYADGSSDEFIVFLRGGSKYSFEDVTADLRQGARLTGFEIFGTDGTTTLDNISIIANTTPVAPTPEPSSLALLGTGLLGALGIARKRLA